jgi:hypothetical protein
MPLITVPSQDITKDAVTGTVARYQMSEGGTLVAENIWDFKHVHIAFQHVEATMDVDTREGYGSEDEMLYGRSHYDTTQAHVIHEVLSDTRTITTPDD